MVSIKKADEAAAVVPGKHAGAARPRVTVVVSNPIQHFCPFYRAIAGCGQVDLRVIFLSPRGSVPFFDRQFGRTIQWQPELLDGFDFRFLADSEPESRSERSQALRRLAGELHLFQPDILVVYGFNTALARRAQIWAVLRRRKVFYISDSPNQRRDGPWQELRRETLLPLAFRSIDAFLTVGDSNREFYRRFGVRDAALFYCPFTVDEKRLAEAARSRPAHRRSLLERYALPADSFVVLFVGKLNVRKRPADLLEAAKLVCDRGFRNVHFILAGDGPDGPMLRAALTPGISSHVHFAGFVPVTELSGYLAAADLLAQPSEYDPHPLSISEALYCGLPVIASNGVGSIGPTDDVQPGVNGFCFDVGDVQALAASICRLASDPELCIRFRQSSRSISARRSVGISVAGFMAAVESVRAGSATRKRDS